MLQLLIKKNEYIQLEILVSLTTKVATKKKHIDSLLNLNPISSYQHIASLNNDLAELFGDNTVRILLEGNNLSINYISSIRDHLIFKKLIQKHLSASSSFTFFLLLASQKMPLSILKTLDMLSISESYLNKLIQSFNSFFQGSQINISKKNNYIHLNAPPQNIILMRYYFNYFISSLEDTTNPSLDDYNHTVYTKPVSKRPSTHWDSFRTNILTTVLTNDTSLLPQIKLTDSSSIVFLNILFNEKNLLDSSKSTNVLPTHSDLYLNFLLHLIQPNAVGAKEKENIVKLVIKKDIPLLSEITDYLQFVANKLGISNEKFASMDMNFHLYNHFITAMSIHIHKVNFKKYLTVDKKTFIQPNILNSYSDISKYFSDIALKDISSDATFILQENKKYFISDLYTLQTEEKYHSTININIDYIFQPALASRIKEKLSRIFNMNTIKFVTDINQTDLVVSDYLIEVPPHIPLFIILDDHSRKSEQELSTLILNLLQSKDLKE